MLGFNQKKMERKDCCKYVHRYTIKKKELLKIKTSNEISCINNLATNLLNVECAGVLPLDSYFSSFLELFIFFNRCANNKNSSTPIFSSSSASTTSKNVSNSNVSI